MPWNHGANSSKRMRCWFRIWTFSARRLPKLFCHLEFAQNGPVAGIARESFEERIIVQPNDPGIAFHRRIQPFEGLIGVAEVGIGLRDLKFRTRRLAQQCGERRVALRGSMLSVVAQG